MKRLLSLLLLVMILLGGCTPGMVEPTFTDAQLATRVNQILTSMPTTTPELSEAPTEATESATGGEATLPAETETPAVPATETPPQIPSETPLLPSVTPANTEEPTQTTTLMVEATLTGTLPATLTPAPTGTLPATDPRLALGTPTTVDPMDNANTWNWPIGSSEYTAMTFSVGKMLLTGLTDVSGWRLPILTYTSDKYIEMKARAQVCSGTDNYGIIFNIPVFNEADRGYLFAVSCDGKYQLREWDGKEGEDGKSTTLIAWKANSAIITGSGKDNRLGVMIKGNQFGLYVNGILLEEFSDSTYEDGYFGVFVNPDNTEKLTIEIDEMSLWNLD
jgi:hypothetical protein